ncbi:MAG TPA: OmpA family protein [Acidobacteriaceae bacterium]|nr:OmpA family protein [Acidobacteriaceae bacterium]
MKSFRYLALLLAVPFAAQACMAQDAAGCTDSPLISRFPGSVLTACNDKADDAFKFDNLGPKKESKTIEGELHHNDYTYPKTASKAQVIRNINTALRVAGYTFDYDSGAYGDFTVHKGKTWIAEVVNTDYTYHQTIVVETALTQDVVADAAALSNGLNGSGHAVVNGILFDTGKAEVKAESAPALAEVAKLLKQDPTLKLYVVGDTDNVGSFAANVDLSRRRALAVAQALTTQYGIAADRLAAYGDGPTAPIASNDTEDGRALNRRVEVVKQ